MDEEKVVQIGDGEDEQWVQTHPDMKTEDKIKDLSITCKPVSLFEGVYIIIMYKHTAI